MLKVNVYSIKYINRDSSDVGLTFLLRSLEAQGSDLVPKISYNEGFS
jgi:hypothetical protein